MFRFIWALSVRTHYYLQRYAPTNIALRAIRTRRGLKWGIPAMLLAAPYLIVANICTSLLASGGPGWLNLVVLWTLWSALKMILMGPWSVVLLTRVRLSEAAARRRARRFEQVDQEVRANNIERLVVAR
jgi:hypothetical protein